MIKWTLNFAVNRLLVAFFVYLAFRLAQNTTCHTTSFDPVTSFPDLKQSFDELLRSLQ